MKTTTAQFEEFKKECRRLQPLLGLTGFDIHFWHKDMEVLATCEYNLRTRRADITLTKSYNHMDDPIIADLAKHEMLHLLIGGLSDLAEQRFGIRESDIDTEEERVVTVLEKLV